jgi:hypothetical protein
MDTQLNPFTATMPKLENVTDKYKFISTAQFIEDVQTFGYKLEDTRKPKRGLGMHSMSFSHPTMPKIEGLDLRLLATNSHDATSAFRLHIQVGVNICANILVSFVPDLAAHSRVVHRGYGIDKVKTAIDAVRSHVDIMLGTVKELQTIDVTPEKGAEFLSKAVELRDVKPYKIIDLQRVLHRGQEANTGWNVFNRVQESIIRGGYRTEAIAEHDSAYHGIVKGQVIPGRRARELTNVKERVQTNYKLWQIAVETLLKA